MSIGAGGKSINEYTSSTDSGLQKHQIANFTPQQLIDELRAFEFCLLSKLLFYEIHINKGPRCIGLPCGHITDSLPVVI